MPLQSNGRLRGASLRFFASVIPSFRHHVKDTRNFPVDAVAEQWTSTWRFFASAIPSFRRHVKDISKDTRTFPVYSSVDVFLCAEGLPGTSDVCALFTETPEPGLVLSEPRTMRMPYVTFMQLCNNRKIRGGCFSTLQTNPFLLHNPCQSVSPASQPGKVWQSIIHSQEVSAFSFPYDGGLRAANCGFVPNVLSVTARSISMCTGLCAVAAQVHLLVG
jgi:hypothetical protein